MPIYYDREGNLYKVEDDKQLKKTNNIEVYNEAGEAFNLPVRVADEFKLTADERAGVVSEIQAKIINLIKVLGLGGWGVPGGSGGCRAIDPPDIDAVLGTRVYPHQQFAVDLMRRILV